MVPLILERERDILSQISIESLILHRYRKLPLEKFSANFFKGDAFYAACGYMGETLDVDSVDKIMSCPKIKGIDYSNSIYNFIGIHLGINPIRENELRAKFNTFSLQNKFITTVFFPFLADDFKKVLDAEVNEFANLVKLLYQKHLTVSDEELISKVLTNNANASLIEIILYGELINQFTRFRYNSLETIDIVKLVFCNFQDAIKHITSLRRKGHSAFSIADEYDVQDILYLILRSIFPKLQFENPHLKIGGSSSKVDLMLIQEGIDIEIKMIKQKDTDEKEFIKQLKIDFNDYATWKELKHLLVFVYDPYNKTTNTNNFYELNGSKSINGVDFNVDITVSN